MEQGLWRGMPYFDVFWRKRHLTQREMRGVFSHYLTYVFLVLAIITMVLLDLHGFAARVSNTALVVYSSFIATLTFILYFLATLLGIKLAKKYEWFYVVYPIVGFFAITLATIVVELGMSSTFGEGLSLARAPEKWPVNLALTLVMETFFITFVVPTVASTARPRAKTRKPDAQPVNEVVSAGGQTFFCDQLISISSQDHYVRLRTKEGEHMIRARMSDLIDQLGSENGIQPHRSHWVSRKSANQIETQDGNKILRLSDGTSVPIARGRLPDVKNWLEELGK